MRNYALMGVTTAARTAVAVGTLVLLARALGPMDFGLVSIVMTWSTIAALITDYGFVMRSLRDIGAKPNMAGEIISTSLIAKTIITISVCVIALPFALNFSDISRYEKGVALIFFFGTLAGSYGDLILTTFRGLAQYHRETRIVIISTIVHFGLLGIAAFIEPTLYKVAYAYFFSRLFYAFLSFFALANQIPLRIITSTSKNSAYKRFKSSHGFALDSAATNIFSQLDVILVNYLLGRESAGIYFAGSRIIQGAVPFSVLLAGIHIPRLASRIGSNVSALKKYSHRVMIEYSATGLVLALIIYFAGPIFTTHIIGEEYNKLNTLWLAFSTYTAIRFVAAGLGVQLISVGAGAIRATGTIFSGAVTIFLYLIFIPKLGIGVIPWVSAFGMFILSVIYLFAVRRIFNNMPKNPDQSMPIV